MANPPRSDLSSPATTKAADSPDPRVLVVDDDRPVSTMLSLILRQYHFAVDVANNGDDAIRLASSRVYDAVLLDLHMPGKDGRAVFRELRALGIETPVMILSAFEAGIARAELGAESAMNKPFEPDVLAEALHQLVHR